MEHLSGLEKKKHYLKMSNEEANKITRESLQTAMIELMRTRDYRDISITELTRYAGTSRTAFYRNYNTKEDILIEICDEIRDSLQESLEQIETYEDPKQWFLEFYRDSYDDRERMSLLLKVDLAGKTNYDKPYWGHFYKNPAIKYSYYRIALESTFWEIFWKWVGDGFKESPEEMAEICVSLYRLFKNL